MAPCAAQPAASLSQGALARGGAPLASAGEAGESAPRLVGDAAACGASSGAFEKGAINNRPSLSPRDVAPPGKFSRSPEPWLARGSLKRLDCWPSAPAC